MIFRFMLDIIILALFAIVAVWPLLVTYSAYRFNRDMDRKRQQMEDAQIEALREISLRRSQIRAEEHARHRDNVVRRNLN